jgi:DNA repair protein RadA/Sms
MVQRRDEQVCGECGAATARWMGRCPACGTWGSLGPAPQGARDSPGGSEAPPQTTTAAELGEEPPVERLATGFAELDRALGGGLVPGSAVLVGGEPGIGKSTLLLQAADRLAATVPVLYATAEESLAQLGRRARRLGAVSPNLRLVAESALERIVAAATHEGPRVLIVDSVQTVRDRSLGAAAGSVVQVRRVADALVEAARAAGRATLLVGHVTKDGAFAGPKTLEHLVDAVLYFEGDDRAAQRVVRCVKNRFGAVDELGVFEMTSAGLVDALDVSARLVFAARPARRSPRRGRGGARCWWSCRR